MIGAFIGNPIGGALSESARGVNEIVGTSAGLATAAAVGANPISPAVASASGIATASASSASTNSSAWFAAGVATGEAFAANQPTTSRHILTDPVDCVLAGQQNMPFKQGRAPFNALRGIFRE